MEEKRFKTAKSTNALQIVEENIESPIVKIISCKLKNPQVYGTNVRYTIVVACSPHEVAFLNKLEDIREKSGTEIFLKEENEEDNNTRLTFALSSKVYPEIFLENGNAAEMKNDLSIETPVKLVFDAVSYTDKFSKKKKLTFPFKKVTVYAKN